MLVSSSRFGIIPIPKLFLVNTYVELHLGANWGSIPEAMLTNGVVMVGHPTGDQTFYVCRHHCTHFPSLLEKLLTDRVSS